MRAACLPILGKQAPRKSFSETKPSTKLKNDAVFVPKNHPKFVIFYWGFRSDNDNRIETERLLISIPNEATLTELKNLVF